MHLYYAYLVGLIEGDGKYVLYELGIELNIKDVQLIYKIKDLLGVGIVSFRERKGGFKKVCLRVRNKSHLINLILPIFDKYPLLSNKQYDYLRFKDALLSGITLYEYLPNWEYTRPTNPLNSVEFILKAESSFCIYKPSNSNSLVASFEISQTNGELLIIAIRNYLSLTQNVTVGSTNNFKIKVSSVRAIENVIKFIQKAPVKLLGYKKLQYLLWIKELRSIERYTNKFNIPQKY
ncbi:the structure and Dna recognition of A bifunctional homing endonuclease and group I intron splicing factor [Tuber brumale]|nr:the structure and Dna recognition of A bifunctional homing endonuclease and group I intron splicing factor [Tuber brumale]